MIATSATSQNCKKKTPDRLPPMWKQRSRAGIDESSSQILPLNETLREPGQVSCFSVKETLVAGTRQAMRPSPKKSGSNFNLLGIRKPNTNISTTSCNSRCHSHWPHPMRGAYVRACRKHGICNPKLFKSAIGPYCKQYKCTTACLTTIAKCS
jgi:hypothetical protein